jgi:hypothetical protein
MNTRNNLDYKPKDYIYSNRDITLYAKSTAALFSPKEIEKIIAYLEIYLREGDLGE